MMKITHTSACVLAATAMSASAAITATSDDFDTGIGANGTWINDPDGAGTTYITASVSWDEVSSNDGGITEGDDLNEDGGLLLDTADAIVDNEAMALTIGGTMETGEIITFSFGAYNDRNSFTNFRAQLYNLTDDTSLAILNTGNIAANIAPDPQDFSFDYTALETDNGDTLQIRFISTGNHETRHIYVDNYSLTSSIPEPSTTALLGLGGLALILRRRK